MNRVSRSFFASVLFLISCCCMSACGGGTDGTGGRRFEGHIVTISGEPVPSVTVTLEEVGDVATTDANGIFSIEHEPALETVTLHFEGNGLEYSKTLDQIPSETTIVHLECVFNPSSEKFMIKSVTYDNGTSHTITIYSGSSD